MSESFCGACKFRGNCSGNITENSVFHKPYGKTHGRLFMAINAVIGNKEQTEQWGTAYIAKDTDGRYSELMITGDINSRDIAEAVGRCTTNSALKCGALADAKLFEESFAPYVTTEKELFNQLTEEN